MEIIEEDLVTIDPEIKQMWIDDLRSGKYEQGMSKLNRNDKLCCLGVLCELAADLKVTVRSEGYHETSYGGITDILPNEVASWLAPLDYRYTLDRGVLPFKDQYGNRVTLVDLNDTGSTFDQIADLIECWY